MNTDLILSLLLKDLDNEVYKDLYIKFLFNIAKDYTNDKEELKKLISIGKQALIESICSYTFNNMSIVQYIENNVRKRINYFLISNDKNNNYYIFSDINNQELIAELYNAFDILTEFEQNLIKYKYGFIDGIYHSPSDCSVKFGIDKGLEKIIEIQITKKIRMNYFNNNVLKLKGGIRNGRRFN